MSALGYLEGDAPIGGGEKPRTARDLASDERASERKQAISDYLQFNCKAASDALVCASYEKKRVEGLLEENCKDERAIRNQLARILERKASLLVDRNKAADAETDAQHICDTTREERRQFEINWATKGLKAEQDKYEQQDGPGGKRKRG